MIPLNPLLMWGALAVSIPIIIHLFHKSRFQVVRWGAMHLLESVLRQNQRRVRFEQWILLLVRCLLPLLLAFLMARPVWKGAQVLMGDSAISTVFVLDNSYSMEAGRTGVSNFSMAREELAKMLSDLKRGSDAQIILMADGGSTLIDQPTQDHSRLLQALQNVQPSSGPATVASALELAGNVLATMREPRRQIVVISDFQRQSFPTTEDVRRDEVIKRIQQQPLSPTVTFVEVGKEVRDNVAIESLDFAKLMVGVGQKIHFRVNLRNFGEAEWRDLAVFFKVDGKEKSRSQIRLGGGEKGQVLFTHAFEAAGSHVVEVTAEADTLKADNTILASIPVRDRLPVLLVNGAPGNGPLKGETDFAELALQPYAAAQVALADLILPTVVAPEKLDGKAIENAAVIILANVRKLNDDQVRALENAVKSGKGLMIFPGDRVDTAWYASALVKGGKGLLPMAFGQLAGDPREDAPSVSVVQQRHENPALELFNDSRNGQLSDGAIKVWYRFKSPDAGDAAQDLSVLARLDSGDAFLIERPFGEGRVIACSTALDADWSNMPMRPFYLPLLQRLTVYLASTIYPPRNIEVNRPIVAFLPESESGKAATITRPDGLTASLKVEKKGGRGVAEYAGTTLPGLYTVTPPSGGAPIHYVANANRVESDLTRLAPEEVDALAKSHGVPVARSAAEFKALEHTRRYGRELWQVLLWALLAFAFFEIFLQQRFAKVRSARQTPSGLAGSGARKGGGASMSVSGASAS